MTLGELISQSTHRLSAHVGGDSEAHAMLRVIMEHLKGYSPVDCALHASDEATPALIDNVSRIIRRVADGEPLQYVLGVARFMGNDFTVTPATLIPRPETAMLVDMITSRYGANTDLTVLDIGTGSGCIATTLARALKFARVTATDISDEALSIARSNADKLKAHVDFIRQDILSATPPSAPSFDIIVSNPPYIAHGEISSIDPRVKDHEPYAALFVPDDNPLIFYRAIATYSIKALRPGGRLYLEINPAYASGLTELLNSTGFYDIVLDRDFNGFYRFASAIKPSA